MWRGKPSRLSLALLFVLILETQGYGPSCPEDLFKCGVEIAPQSWCISRAWVCDGDRDCPDGSDEGPECGPPTCPPSKFQCRDKKLCIPMGWQCDKEEDCIDGSDESDTLCSEPEFSCPPNQHLCPGTSQCIKYMQVCDGIPDCMDAWDEGPHCTSTICMSQPCPGDATCRPLGSGDSNVYACACSMGLYWNGTQCTNLNECTLEGYCDQLCSDQQFPYQCSCAAGYTKDGNLCRASNEPLDAPSFILYANRHEIRQIYLNGSELDSPVRIATDRTQALDYDFDNQTVCYITERTTADVNLECSSITDLDTRWQVKPMYKLTGVQSFARDWIAKNWYFTDGAHERIFVCNDTFAICITLIITDLKSPESIAVDPQAGYMFFSTISETAKVERALLDGSERLSLVKDKQVVRPHAITIDYVMQHVYWADSYLDKIERINYDGSGRVVDVLKKSWIEKIFGLAVHESFLYAASHGNNTINRIRRYNNTIDGRTILNFNQIEPHSIKIYNRQRQPQIDVDNPCSSAGCSDLCINMRRVDSQLQSRCLCRAGYKLQDDKQCISALEDRFLLYANGKLGEVKGISLVTPQLEVIPPVTGLARPVAVDYHAATQFIYYSDTPNFSIGRVKVDGSERNDSFISTGIGNCEGIAIDWMGENIYWTDENYKTISVAQLKDTSSRKVLISTNMTHPRAIVVDPRLDQGYMYWSDWAQSPAASRNASISRANLDGTNRIVLVDELVMWINGLSLDYASKKLYWCDAYTDRIEVIELMNNNKRTTFVSQGLIRHPYGLVHIRNSLDEVQLYWTEFVDGHIKNTTIRAGTNSTLPIVTVIKNESQPLFEIRLFDNNTQIECGQNLCAEANCSHLCLGGPTLNCQCPDIMILNADQTTCSLKTNYTSPLGCSEVDEFECLNKKCINKRWLCDGDNDCGDNSDEDNNVGGICYNKTCPNAEQMYRCRNNKCIYRRWLCDGEDDCRNNEDEEEANCTNDNCEKNMTRCNNTMRCIPNSWRCDHDDDCGDGSDEENCEHSMCDVVQFTCANKRCISTEYVCDGDNDCRDNSDEANCPDSCTLLGNNTDGVFRCKTQDKCIRRSLVCDGEHNCDDHSDEEDCDAYTQCNRTGQFSCDNGFCINVQLRCDGDDDCGDETDERDCHSNITCGNDDYKCPNEARCLPRHWVCDGDNDCQDNSDEADCVPVISCEEPARLCVDNGGSSICLPPEKLCDNIADCANATDEGGLCDLDLCASSSKLCQYKCVSTPYGYLCTCPEGERLAANGRSCIEADPCSKWGICSQRCEAIAASYMCSCFDGFYLEADLFSCKPIDEVETFIIFSNRHEIRRLDVVAKSYVSLVSGLRNTIALDFYYNKTQPTGDGSLVFWTDVIDDKIYRGTVIANSVTNIQPIVNIGLSTTEGIAVDWVAQHIYWVESNLDQIEVATFDGSKRATLIAGNITSPRAIVVDPRKGLLFWSDWDTSMPRIERASMSGENRSLIFNVSSIVGAGWPNGLTIDYDSYRLYWIDARSDSIHTIDYYGLGHHEVLRGHEFLSHPFAISVFGNHVYWTDWRTNSLVQANKWNGTNAVVIQRTITQPFDLFVFHPRRQPNVTNPCAENNGGCRGNALCLLTLNAKPQCKCPHLYRLAEDKKTCDLDSNFLLYARKQEIRGVDLESATTNFIPALTVPFVYNPMAIDYDALDKKLYWVDGDPTTSRSHHGIIRANLNGTGVETIIDSNLPNPGGLAIDWMSRNMYFTSYSATSASISVSRLDGVYRKVILDQNTEGINMSQPNSIAVHPAKGKMFWSDSADSGSIYIADMDGGNPRKIFPVDMVHGTDFEVGQIKSLSLDYEHNELWFINYGASKDVILSCNLDGKDLEVRIHNTTCGINSPSAIVVYNNMLYVANNDSNNIQRVAITSGTLTTCTELRSGIDSVRALKVYRNINGTSHCENNGGCSQLCLPTGTSTHKTCKCTVGFKLLEDGVTCEGVDSFLMYSVYTNIEGISMNPEDPDMDVLAPMSKISKAAAIDFYAAEDYIYWVDSQLHTISRIKRDLTNRSTLITSKLFGIEAVSIDWIAGNMYWVDSGLEVIEAAKLDGSKRFVVLSENLYNPQYLVLHPQQGFMYWASYGMNPKIERAYLDGDNRESYVTDVKKPVHLTIDYEREVLYWYEKEYRRIECQDLKTGTRRNVSMDVTDVAGLDVFQGYIYWADSSTQGGSVYRMRTNGTDKQVLKEHVATHIQDVKVFDKRKQTGSNLCVTQTNSCQELCFYRNDKCSKCECAYGRVVNQTLCEQYTEFLAYSKVTGIDSVHMYDNITSSHNRPMPPINLPQNMSNVIGLSFDYSNKKYFYSDIQKGDIQAVFFNGTYDKVIVANVGSAEGLVYESINNYLYWTSYTDSSINRLLLYHEGAETHKIVQLTTEDHPRAIAVDSCESKIYWTNWNDRQASIQTAYITGSRLKSIITSDIRTPNGLAIDLWAQKLYWSDARLDKIERCDYNGLNRKVIIRNMPQHIFGLAIYEDFLFWTDWMMRGVLRANKYTGQDVKWLRKNIERQPMGIVAVGKSSCVNKCSFAKGGCSDVCNLDEYGNVTCSCYEGRFLNTSDNVTCLDPASACGPSEFACLGQGCILYEFICDGLFHCADKSDENPTMCRERNCPPSYFPCQSSNRCIPESRRCNHVNDCEDGSDERQCGCGPDEFQCGNINGSCIQARYRCDYDKDCPDASDEKDCNMTNCDYFRQRDSQLSNLTKCPHTTACILDSWKCDGHNDCWDNWDELNCTTTVTAPPCPESWYKCATTTPQECIPMHWQCDGDMDCSDDSDEADCMYTCSADQIQCDTRRCIPRTWQCDGHFDCEDHKDEQNCTSRTCYASEFACNSSHQCIPNIWVCDGEKDCAQGEDELPTAGCDPVPCDLDEFQCLNYQCIPGGFYCDGDEDCLDGSDEPKTCRHKSCDSHQFQCIKSKACIPLAKKCDHYFDCSDHSDEDNVTCAATTQAPPCGTIEKYKCNNGICINVSLVCDTWNDCGDNSDELLCNVNECKTGVCQHNCTDKKIGYECSCREGYTLEEDQRSCKDVDECWDYKCSHFCVNMPGSYRCTCADGYRLSSDKTSCKVTDDSPTPVLMFTNRYYIRNVTLGWANKVELVAMNLTNAVALDFDWQDRKIYWSDVTSSVSRILRMSENGSGIEVLHNSTLRNPDGIAVDWVGRNLYWCDKTTDTIEVSKLNGLYRKILVRSGLQEPRAIAVHPYKGYIFYTDWGDNAHIGRLGMDGSEQTQIISENLGWPNALTLDFVTSHIIWADARLDYIAMADLSGKHVHYIVKNNLPHIFALTQFEEYIYWTDWEYKSVERAHKYRGDMRKNLTHTIHRPMDIHVYHPYRQRPLKKAGDWVNPCADDGGCHEGTLCLIKPHGTARVCACPEHHYPSTDKTRCLANCTSSEFLCARTHKCIPFWWKCNKHDDCGDGSDEPDTCEDYVCRQPGLFQCRNASSEYHCISPTQICDGIPQCPNGSDEENCEAHTCLDSQFKCTNAPKCIPLSQKCNSIYNCDDHTDEKDCPELRCAANQHQCDNKRCIPYVWRCDNDNDCGDNSDEPENCGNTTCREGFIQCKQSGRCVPESWRCDGDYDCADGSDEPEEICDQKTCEGTYFACNNSRCIPRRWRCDYDDDCRDGSDEMNCTPRNCSESEFRCNNNRCIPNMFRCDGRHQCSDDSDEKDCNGTCGRDKFRCNDSGYCLPMSWKCDGEFDCADRSDETNCSEVACGGNEFQCDGVQCIPNTWQCDGTKDCMDGTDEARTMCRTHPCPVGYFRCVEDFTCIPYRRLCDGHRDCSLGTDELHCPGLCEANEFKCNTTGQCIPASYVCDDRNDCVDHSDEIFCEIRRNCSHDKQCPANFVCNPDTQKCDCKPGTYLSHLNGKCEDINECHDFGRCQQICHNTNGSYECDCRNEFKRMMKDDQLVCIPPGPAPYLLIAAENEILYSSTSQSQRLGRLPDSDATQPRMNISGMDIHMPKKEAYFTNALGEVPTISKYSITSWIPQVPNKSRRPRRELSDDRGEDADQPQNEMITDLQIEGLDKPVDLAIDWVSDKIYWLDAGTNSIQMANLDGIGRRTIINTNLQKPGAIVLEPVTRRIFWTDWGSVPKIEAASLDGSDRNVIVSEDIYRPSGIAIDYASHRLYWTDSKKRTVETAYLDGRERQTVWTFQENQGLPHKIEVYLADLYVTTFRTHDVYRIHNGAVTQLVDYVPRIRAIVVVQDLKQQDYANNTWVNPCHRKPCSAGAICVNKFNNKCGNVANCVSGGNGTVCLCPDGKVMNASNPGNCVVDTTPPSDCDMNCLNNGTCIETEHGMPKCSCTKKFTGTFCETEKCAGYCLNNGTCTLDSADNPECRCPMKYNGTRCEQYKCTNRCHSHGLCYVDHFTEEAKCVCDYNHSGTQCEIDAPGCVAFTCLNGRSCKIERNRPTCDCGDYYLGEDCGMCRLDPASSSEETRTCVHDCFFVKTRPQYKTVYFITE